MSAFIRWGMRPNDRWWEASSDQEVATPDCNLLVILVLLFSKFFSRWHFLLAQVEICTIRSFVELALGLEHSVTSSLCKLCSITLESNFRISVLVLTAGELLHKTQFPHLCDGHSDAPTSLYCLFSGFFFFFFFGFWPHCMAGKNLSFPTRDWACSPYTGSAVLPTEPPQGSPHCVVLRSPAGDVGKGQGTLLKICQ